MQKLKNLSIKTYTIIVAFAVITAFIVIVALCVEVETLTVNHVASDAAKQVPKQVDVQYDMPEESRGKTAEAVVINNEGQVYNYTIFQQGAGYESHSKYLKNHGCSTCALTSVLRASSDELADTTPDKVIEDIEQNIFGEVIGEEVKMPISLVGMTKVLDKYGIKYKRPKNCSDMNECENELTEHLKAGNPAIVTFGNAKAGHLTSSVHTIVLMGIDDEGYLYIGDSVHKKKKYWGDMGLIKYGAITVSDMLSYIKGDDWYICEGNDGPDFYKGSDSQGYLLIYK